MAQLDYQARLASLRTRAVVAQVLLVLFMVVAGLVSLYTGILTWREFSTSYSTFLIVQPGMALFLLVAILPAAIGLSAWLWRAHANLHADGREALNYTPGWAVGSLALPFVNLVVPMQAMRELWNRSHGEEQWGARQTVAAVSSWWTCFVCGALLHTVLMAVVLLDLGTNLAIITPPGVNMFFLFFATALLGVSAWYLYRIIGAITRAQHTATHVGDTFA